MILANSLARVKDLTGRALNALNRKISHPEVPWAARPVVEGAYPWASKIGLFLDRILYRAEITGQEHLPSHGGVLIAANHSGLLDGPALYGAFPREGHIIVKREMFASPVGWLLHASGQIGIDRSGDRRVLTSVVGLLKKGKIVGILPEGTRGTGAVTSISSGVAWIAVAAGVPVVPAAILGTRATGRSTSSLPRLRSRVVIEFGEPVDVSKRPGESGRETMKRAAEEIRVALSDHVRAAQQRTGMKLPEA